jgi:hypothetical protein
MTSTAVSWFTRRRIPDDHGDGDTLPATQQGAFFFVVSTPPGFNRAPKSESWRPCCPCCPCVPAVPAVPVVPASLLSLLSLLSLCPCVPVSLLSLPSLLAGTGADHAGIARCRDRSRQSCEKTLSFFLTG